MQTSSITAKGQVTIPASIRKALGLESGGQVAFEIDGDSVKLIPGKKDLRAAFGLIKSDKSVSLDEMERAIADDRPYTPVNGCQNPHKSGDRTLNPENTPFGVLCAVAG